MPLSANEETGFKPITRQSIDYPAGIPIKKRRFPLIRPPSPPPEEQSLCPGESNSLQKDQSSPSQGSTLSYSSVATSSSGLSDTVKYPESEERRGSSGVANDCAVPGNINLCKVKVEEPSFVVQPGSVANMNSDEKLVMAKNSANQIISEKNELKLAPAGSLALTVGIDMPIKQRTEVKVEPVVSALRENNKSLLSLKEHFVSALSSQNSGSSGQNQRTLEPISLDLSLSKEGSSSSQCKSDNAFNLDSAHLHANRANWDLNIPMDTWEGTSSDTAVSQTSAEGIDVAAGRTQGIQPLIGLAVTGEKPMSIEKKNITNFSLSSGLSSYQYKSNDSLHLQLSPSCLSLPVQEPPTTTPKLNSNKVIPISNLPRVVVPISNLNKVNIRPVKSEPVEERINLDTTGAKPSSVRLLDGAAVKKELVDQGSLETHKTSYICTPKSVDQAGLETLNASDFCTQKSVDPKSIKSEPALEGKEAIRSVTGMSVKLNEQVARGPDENFSSAVTSKPADVACPAENSSFSTENKHSSAAVTCSIADTACPVMNPPFSAGYKHSSAPETSKTAEIACPVVNSSVSTGMAMSGDLLKQSRNLSSTSEGRSEVLQEACEHGSQVTPEVGATSTGIDTKVDSTKAEDSKIDDPKLCESKSKVANDPPLRSRGDGVGTVSDEEKLNISADIEDSYTTDYESDGNHAIDMAIDMELDSDYEDGEVREPLEGTAVEEPVGDKGRLEHIDNTDSNRNVMGTVGLVNDPGHTSHVEEKSVGTDTAEIEMKDGEEASGALHSYRSEKEFDKTECLQGLQEPSTVQTPPSGAPLNEANKAAVRIPLDQLGKTDAQERQETNSEQAAYGGEEIVLAVAQGTGPSLDKDEFVPQGDTALAKLSSNDDNAAKDIDDNGSHRSRIINLPRSSGSPPHGRNRNFSGRIFPSRPGRERFSDVANEGERIYFRGREEIYIDDTQKFSRERHHDQAPRNSRFNFMRGRGRNTSRLDSFRGDRESDRDFASEFHNSQTEYRVPRNKYASSASDADREYSTYNISQDGGFVGSGRGVRKPLNDDGPFVRRMPPRRRSPGVGRGIHMVRRIPRNISPSRCIGEDGSELVRLRRNEKFGRGFQDDAIDPVYPRSQPQFEGVDGHFAQGNRNFPVQRRVMHQIRSKSPLGSRTRSPGPWPSPRGRSPDGFAGHPDLTHQRSPFYRIDRMRSPDRRCFPGEVVVRRHDARDMDSGRDHGHPGSGMPNRSPPSRIALRERRFGGIDPQERPENDDFFGGPMHSGRLHELGGDVNGEERRFGERRVPVRPFRAPPFNGAEGEGFHLNPEDGSRPLRFCPDDDAEFQERGNLIEREFHRRIKNRPGNPPRRMRNIEEPETNYRHGGQVWHNNEFDEISRVKRKRF